MDDNNTATIEVQGDNVLVTNVTTIPKDQYLQSQQELLVQLQATGADLQTQQDENNAAIANVQAIISQLTSQ